ncbi:MAG: hypothetical protein ACFNLD_09985 [Kingella oralis]
MEFGGSPIFCQFGDELSPFHFGFQPASTIPQKFQAASNPQRQPENIISTSLQPLTFRLPHRHHFFPHFAFTAATVLSSFAPSTSPSSVCSAPHLGKRTTV